MALARWRDRVAFVTGASSGVGNAVARELARAGVRVAAVARRRERLAALREQCGPNVRPIVCDLTREAEIVQAFDQVRTEWGGVDIAINAAGLGHNSSLADGSVEAWRETLEVNVLAACITAREAIADMRRQGVDGQIVHVSSMAGHRLHREDGMYPSSKFALRAAAETLRRELRRAGSKVRVAVVSPGLIETEFAGRFYGDPERAKEIYRSITPLQPGDIAATIVYILDQPPHVDVNDVCVRPVEQEA